MASPDTAPVRRSSSESAIPSAPPLRTLPLPSSSSNAGLTEGQLRDHDRRTNSSFFPAPSPYYLRSHGLSPGRESLASARSISSAITGKLHLWGAACFFSRREDRAPLADPGSLPPGVGASGLTGTSATPVVGPDAKPLRERDTKPKIGAIDGLLAAGEEKNKKPPPKEIEFVWAYKYRPRTLKEFICNRNRAEELHRMVKTQECCHFIFEGPPGVGKKTMVLAFLREAFGPEKMKMKNELKRIELKGEHVGSIDLNVRKSSQHIEVNLSESRGYEKHVIMTLINEFHIPSDQPVPCDQSNCRAIVLHEADKISNDAQHYVRWLMDKYNKGCNKLFFCCSDASKLQPIKHLCKIINLKPPSDKEIVEVLEFIADREGVVLPHHLAEIIAKNSKHNLRQAIRSFEASWKSYHQLGEIQDILTGWEVDIANIARNIIEEQSPKQLYTIRGKLKNLIEHDVSPAFIFNTLVSELKKHLDEHFQLKVVALYQEYNIWDNNGQILNKEKAVGFSGELNEDSAGKRLHDRKKNVQHFMRIEEFTAKFMSFYKAFITKNNGETSNKCPSGPSMA
ncbi:hypothetical protein J5N97_018766 [Dioscorea zingiberensis]|uniref:Replication factor C subunit 3 n=1 Tax=Dioscorea zingiberensis TaxID=325984 RepID=A0A9D5CCS1_9LILI|nr:hypothetical protein J5N97_018766 [Dioscorea zingiberensis]